jgi:hypothetical protein
VGSIFELLNKERPAAEEKIDQPRRNADLRAFLLDTLANGPVLAAAVKEQGVARGFTTKQILYTRARMNIVAIKETRKRHGKWLWALLPPTRVASQAPSERATQ